MIKDEEILELWTANQDIIAFSRTLIELARSEKEERNFCPRCGKRLAGLSFLPNAVSIHTCTPPLLRLHPRGIFPCDTPADDPLAQDLPSDASKED